MQILVNALIQTQIFDVSTKTVNTENFETKQH